MGVEDRFGSRNQILEFYPVYEFVVDGIDTENGESVSGRSISYWINNKSFRKYC